jgi:uncharacterized membrane protein YgcG
MLQVPQSDSNISAMMAGRRQTFVILLLVELMVCNTLARQDMAEWRRAAVTLGRRSDNTSTPAETDTPAVPSEGSGPALAAQYHIHQTQSAGSACSGSEGQWNCMTDSWQRCAAGQWSVVMQCSLGTICTPAGLTNDFHVEYAPGYGGTPGGSSSGGSSTGGGGSGSRRGGLLGSCRFPWAVLSSTVILVEHWLL